MFAYTQQKNVYQGTSSKRNYISNIIKGTHGDKLTFKFDKIFSDHQIEINKYIQVLKL